MPAVLFMLGFTGVTSIYEIAKSSKGGKSRDLIKGVDILEKFIK